MGRLGRCGWSAAAVRQDSREGLNAPIADILAPLEDTAERVGSPREVMAQ